MKLLDTSLLVDYARGSETAADYLDANDSTVFGAPTVVLAEVYTGLFITTEMDREAIQAAYGWVTCVAFTEEAALEAAAIRARLREEGEDINKSDTYIAGTARAFDLPLVTGDSDFEKIENLDVEHYRANA